MVRRGNRVWPSHAGISPAYLLVPVVWCRQQKSCWPWTSVSKLLPLIPYEMLLQQENTSEPGLGSSNRKKNNIRVIAPDIWASQLSWSLMVSISIELTEGQYHNSSLSEPTCDSIERKVGRKHNPPLVMISATLWAAKMWKVVTSHCHSDKAWATLAAGACAAGALQPLENQISPEPQGCQAPPSLVWIARWPLASHRDKPKCLSDRDTVLLLVRSK